MKKMLAITVLMILVLSVTAAADSPHITMEEAQQIALDHAQLTAEEVVFTEEKIDRDDGRLVYDIEFLKDRTEYDYEIDQLTGEIMSFDNDAEFIGDPLGEITAEQALDIALKQAELTLDDVHVIKTKLDYDDGMRIYEIEFLHGRIEYECDINASNGQIVEWDRDYD